MVRVLISAAGMAAGVAAAAVATACYKPASTECVFQCNATSGCPAGLTCANGFCIQPGSGTVCGAASDADPDGLGFDANDGDGGDNPDAPMPMRRYRVLSAGGHHACAIDTAGQLWCWGLNDNRQLGVATVENFAGVPQHVQPGMSGGQWRDVSAGSYHTCALFEPSSGAMQMWCWGQNFNFETGVVGASPQTPHQVAPPSGQAWKQVAAGAQHTCAVVENTTDSNQTVMCWGAADRAQLGNGVSGANAFPQTINPTNLPTTVQWRSLTAGSDHSCAIADDNRVYCWGDNRERESGQPSDATQLAMAVSGPSTFSRVTAGDSFTCGIDAIDATLRCWGRNSAGELGIGAGTNDGTPTPVMDQGASSTWKRVAAGLYGACGIQGPMGSTDPLGTVRCWGGNDFGERGTGTFLTPTSGPSAGAGDNAFAIDAGHQFACALFGDPVNGGDLRCWGDNGDGQIGTGQASDHRRPIRVGEGVQNGQPWIAVAAGRAHTCAVLGAAQIVDRQLYCWGLAASGQIDAVPGTLRRAPVRVNGSDGVVDLVVGSSHTCALRELVSPPGSRQIRCWGSDEARQLGMAGNAQPGPTQISLAPFFPTGLRGAGNVTCGANPSGTQCWGESEIATPDYIMSDMPAQPTLDTADQPNETLSAGPSSACWIDAANTRTLCFGSNSFGQLGYGMAAQPTMHPVAVMGLSDATALSRGPSNHRCAITTGSVVKCWGANGYNQAGAGDGMDKVAPVTVMAPNVFDSVATGLNHTCGLTSGGVIWCWGNNDQYQRTAIQSGSSLPPTAIVAPQNEAIPTWTAIATGEYHTCAITSTGALYCWGASRWGQVGAGSASETTPVPVLDGTP